MNDGIGLGVSPQTYENSSIYCGVGTIVLDRQLSREDYIQQCYFNNTVNIRTDRGVLLTKCSVSRSVWSDIEFPATYKDVGSLVIWLNTPISNRNIVIGSLNKLDEKLSIGEHQSRFGNKQLNTHYDNSTGIITHSINVPNVGSGVRNNILNEDKNGLYKTYVQGQIIQQSERDTVHKSTGKYEIIVSDEEQELEDGEVLKTNSITIKENVGIRLFDQYDNLIDTTEQGIDIIDANGNKYETSEQGISITSNQNNNQKFDEKGVHIQLDKKEQEVDLIAKEYEKIKEKTVLADKLIDVLTDITDSMISICNDITTIVTLHPSGNLDPASIAKFQLRSNSLSAIKNSFKNIKSKNVNIT